MAQDNKVKYAPAEVIFDLDYLSNEAKEIGKLYPIGILDSVLKEITEHPDLYEPYSWMKTEDEQLAVINHIIGTERLQPERETRYYVEFYDYDGDRTLVYKDSVYLPISLGTDSSYIPKYEESLDHATAIKAQVLYGGTIEEIN